MQYQRVIRNQSAPLPRLRRGARPEKTLFPQRRRRSRGKKPPFCGRGLALRLLPNAQFRRCRFLHQLRCGQRWHETRGVGRRKTRHAAARTAQEKNVVMVGAGHCGRGFGDFGDDVFEQARCHRQRRRPRLAARNSSGAFNARFRIRVVRCRAERCVWHYPFARSAFDE